MRRRLFCEIRAITKPKKPKNAKRPKGAKITKREFILYVIIPAIFIDLATVYATKPDATFIEFATNAVLTFGPAVAAWRTVLKEIKKTIRELKKVKEDIE